MGRLTILSLGFLLCFSPENPAAANQVGRWAGHISEASARFGVPDAWIRRVIAAESGGRTRLNGRPIESHVGAMGLMQLMPGTWQAMRAAHSLGRDPHDPRDNILAGTAYLRMMYDRFGYPGLFAAYNAGPGAYGAYLAGRRRLPAETMAYVARVAAGSTVGGDEIRTMPVVARRTAEPAREASPLFAIRTVPGTRAVDASTPPARAGASLFVPLHVGQP
jgi:membrane-bound lytic murein transglycosylase B